MEFVADLGPNSAPKFIEEFDGGLGGWIPAWVVKLGQTMRGFLS